METYDPLKAPAPDAWQEMDEDERLTLVLDYHRRADDEPPNEQAHAAMHVAVENQVALGDEIPVRANLERLIGEGLDRHTALHAISTLFAEHMFSILQSGAAGPEANEAYYERLSALTAAQWLEDYGQS